jgi:EAL domain-containing protein (putative c-di-GMP-specific phosphodiesterase class I)
MRPLTLRVIEQALTQAAQWQARPLQVSVNLAPASLLDVRFPGEVADLLSQSGLPPEVLRLEITEDTIMVDPERVLDTIARLGELGLTFALDDFGTGYSSLAYLKRLPLRVLKIDRSFVMEMQHNRDDLVIVRSTVELGRSLGLEVIAEGVETRETWDDLVRFGCHGAQGYYLSPPLPAEALADWLNAREALLSA